MKGHEVIFLPYTKCLDPFLLKEVSKNLWNEQTSVGGKGSVEALPHTWKNNSWAADQGLESASRPHEVRGIQRGCSLAKVGNLTGQQLVPEIK